MPRRYIVVYKEGTPASVIEKHVDDLKNTGCSIGHRYDSVLLGFSVTVEDEDHFTSTFAENEHIDYIEPDAEVTIQ
ncbi:protease propeptide/inhibitor [Syncephalastrum racemosum]|uniref:Protease propeptide/inhibitor n=1 Tax=Syncephalastrum racemosum TaxID=13706 RepID=A0A1X2GZM8_SYNRA|nr:protease propeptide/inhibitor [Syncephalastrum racemosum]